MKKIKIVMVSMAIVIGVGGAFANRINTDCTSHPQFYRDGMYYVEAGDYGVDYTCAGTIGVCTYYRPNPVTNPNYYLPCRNGFFTPLY
jgi:hypothetical protein